MKNSLFCAASLLLVLASSSAVTSDGAGGAPGPITQDELVRRSQELFDAVVTGDQAPWKTYYADDCVFADEKGRLMVVMAHNTDIPDTWEREGELQQYFDLFSPSGYALGVNIALYNLTH